MIYHWWDDALAVANGYAQTTGIRYRVQRTLSGLWSVGPSDGPR